MLDPLDKSLRWDESPLFGFGEKQEGLRVEGYGIGIRLEDQNGQGVLRDLSYLWEGGQWTF